MSAAEPTLEVQPNAPAPLLDAGGAAELLNVPKSWVLAEARAGRIPHLRLGRYVRFESHALEAWWANRRRGPQPTRRPRDRDSTPPDAAHTQPNRKDHP